MTLTKITSKSIKDNEIVNADLHSAAAIASTKLAKPIDLADNEKIRLGTSQDLEVFHDGNNSIINDNGTGELQLQRAGNTILTLDANGVSITDPDGAAQVSIKGFEGNDAYLNLTADEGDDNGDRWSIVHPASNNTLRLKNNISGSLDTKWTITTDGDVVQTGHLDLPDSKEIRLGNSDDFTMYHDGSNSFIRDAGTGVLTLDTNGSKIQLMADGTSSKTLANFIKDGAVELYHNGTKKFETASTGLYGHTFMPSTNGGYDLGANATRWRHVYIKDDGIVRFGDSDDLQIYFDGTNSFIKEPNSVAGQLIIDGYNGTDIRQGSTGDNMIRALGGGAVQLYHDNALRFQTTADGAKLENNGDGGSDVLMLVENERDDSGSDAILRLRVSNGSAHSEVQFGDAGNMDTGIIDYHHSNNRMRFTVDATEVWQTRSNGICPSSSGKNCGFSNSSNRWADVRSSNFGGSSDRNEKNTIVTSDLGLDFINKLKPVSFKWNDGVAGRTHYGLVAQDIEDLLPDFGKTAMDFAALCKDTFTEDENGNTVDSYDVYSLRYMEFISPLVKAIQELTAKVAALEAA